MSERMQVIITVAGVGGQLDRQLMMDPAQAQFLADRVGKWIMINGDRIMINNQVVELDASTGWVVLRLWGVKM